MNEGTAPQVHPAQRLAAPDGTQADIDTEIVPLVRALWALGPLASTAQIHFPRKQTASLTRTLEHIPR